MQPSALTHEQFIAVFGPVYEDSPWVAEGVWPAVEEGRLDDEPALAEAMRAVVDGAPEDRRLKLIRAHPELASRTKMADASVREQSGAGLDQCSADEFAAFQQLNGAYNRRFDFPFIVAVKGLTRADILEAMVERLGNDPDAEFATAIAEIHRIAGFRIADLFRT